MFMNNNLYSDIKARNELIAKTAKEIEKRLENLPDGRINVKHRKTGNCYYQVGDGGCEKYLTDVKKPISDDIPVYTTMRGERVRSKSEIIIADRLFANGIPYKYECPLKVGNEIIHPDFTILRMSDRKILYHEHCGMADDSGYAEDMVKRINDYSEEGIIQGDSLFLSFETSKQPLDVRVIDRLINSHFR